MSKKLPTYFCQKERSMVGGVKGSLQNFQKIICFGFFLCPLFANPPSQVCLHCTLCCAQSQQDHRQLMFGFGLGGLWLQQCAKNLTGESFDIARLRTGQWQIRNWLSARRECVGQTTHQLPSHGLPRVTTVTHGSVELLSSLRCSDQLENRSRRFIQKSNCL